MHDNALPAALSDILVNRFHLIINIVGEEVVSASCAFTAVDMILRVISRDFAFPEKTGYSLQSRVRPGTRR